MVPVPLSRLQASRKEEIVPWPYLDQAVLVKAHSRKVCITKHWFQHCAGVNCISLLTCQLHQGLIFYGEHLTSRCQGWTDDQVRQQGSQPSSPQWLPPPSPAER